MKTITAPWYEIRAAADGGAYVRIYGEIGFEVQASTFVDELARIDREAPITVEINSPGGSVWEGLAIFNALLAHRGPVTTIVSAIAASMGSVIAMAGDRVQAYPVSMLMVHNPAAGSFGDHRDHTKVAEVLQQTRELLLDAYMRRVKATRAEVTEWLDRETWFTASEALEVGLIDELLEEELEMAACLRGLDLSRFTALPPQLAAAKHKEPTMNTQKTEPKNIAAGVEQERERVRSIRALFAPHQERPGVTDAMLEAIDEGVDVEKAKDALIVALGRSGSAKDAEPVAGPVCLGFDGRARKSEFRQAALDLLSIRNGIPVEQPHPAVRDIERMGLADIAATILSQRGVSTSGMSRDKIVSLAVRNSFGHGTDDFSHLLGDHVHRALMAGYGDEPYSADGWTSVANVADFRTQYRVQLSEAPSLDEVGEHGEYKSGSMTDAVESYAITTYGKIFALSRHAIINDDLMAFTRIPRGFGQAARRKELDLIIGILTGNPAMRDGDTLFHANHGNIGTSAALSVESLGEARALMRKQTGEAGIQVLNIAPRYLIVPSALETTAEQLLASLVDPSKSNDTANPSWIRSLDLRVDARLDATSELAWYLAASPMQVDTIERGYLDGQAGVSITEQEGFEKDGMAWKARLDFGTKALDWRGLVYNAGA